MRQGIHPDYGPVAFRDIGTGTVFVTGSTLAGTESQTVDLDGSTSPGDVEGFHRRYGDPCQAEDRTDATGGRR